MEGVFACFVRFFPWQHEKERVGELVVRTECLVSTLWVCTTLVPMQRDRGTNLTTPNRQIQEIKFAHHYTLNTLGLFEPVEHLMSKVSIDSFLWKEAPTYERYALEFLSTLETWSDEDGAFISFHLNDTEHCTSYMEAGEAFGCDYEDDGSFERQEVCNEAVFWHNITNGLNWHARCKYNSIPQPALRYVHCSLQ